MPIACSVRPGYAMRITPSVRMQSLVDDEPVDVELQLTRARSR